MPVFALLPLIIVGIIVAAASNAAKAKQREAQARAARERQTAAPVQPAQQPLTPIRPSVQVPRPVQEGPRPGERVQTQVTPRMQNPATERKAAPAQMHAGHDFCALRPEDPKEHPTHDLCALKPEEVAAPLKTRADDAKQGVRINFTPDNIMQAVLFSEILGKPKALQ